MSVCFRISVLGLMGILVACGKSGTHSERSTSVIPRNEHQETPDKFEDVSLKLRMHAATASHPWGPPLPAWEPPMDFHGPTSDDGLPPVPAIESAGPPIIDVSDKSSASFLEQRRLFPFLFIPYKNEDHATYDIPFGDQVPSSGKYVANSVIRSGTPPNISKSNHQNYCFMYFSDKVSADEGKIRDQELRTKVLKDLATRSRVKRVWHRWGNEFFEYARTGMIPAFDLPEWNANVLGQFVAGKGIYLAGNIRDSSEYAIDPPETGLVTYITPIGYPVIDLASPQIKAKLANNYVEQYRNSTKKRNQRFKLGPKAGQLKYPRDYGPDPSDLVFDCNPPALVKNYSATGGWHVMKKASIDDDLQVGAPKYAPKFVEVRPYTGEFETTEELFRSLSYFEQSGQRTHFHDRYFKLHYVHRILMTSGTFKHRIYRPRKPEPQTIPIVSMTAVYPHSTWKHHPETRLLKAAELIGSSPLQYFWRYDGSCGAYYREGAILDQDDVDPSLCEKSEPLVANYVCQALDPVTAYDSMGTLKDNKAMGCYGKLQSEENNGTHRIRIPRGVSCPHVDNCDEFS